MLKLWLALRHMSTDWQTVGASIALDPPGVLDSRFMSTRSDCSPLIYRHCAYMA